MIRFVDVYAYTTGCMSCARIFDTSIPRSKILGSPKMWWRVRLKKNQFPKAQRGKDFGRKIITGEHTTASMCGAMPSSKKNTPTAQIHHAEWQKGLHSFQILWDFDFRHIIHRNFLWRRNNHWYGCGYEMANKRTAKLVILIGPLWGPNNFEPHRQYLRMQRKWHITAALLYLIDAWDPCLIWTPSFLLWPQRDGNIKLAVQWGLCGCIYITNINNVENWWYQWSFHNSPCLWLAAEGWVTPWTMACSLSFGGTLTSVAPVFGTTPLIKINQKWLTCPWCIMMLWYCLIVSGMVTSK